MMGLEENGQHTLEGRLLDRVLERSDRCFLLYQSNNSWLIKIPEIQFECESPVLVELLKFVLLVMDDLNIS